MHVEPRKHAGRPPLLKAPVWSAEVSSYFFLGGLSGGALLLARVAERCGGQRYRGLARRATYLSLATVVPCAPLLIADLGDPKRFHHMLRVWKPTSPMNFGAWTLTAHSAAAALASLRELLHARRQEETAPTRLSRVLPAALDAGSLPFALILISYTGVLLAGTATPVWSRNPWLTPLFAASALSSAAQGVTLLEAVTSGEPAPPLRVVRTVAAAAEGALLAGYVRSAKARGVGGALTGGDAAPYLWGAGLGLVLAEALAHAPLPPSSRRLARAAAGLAGVAAGWALRVAVVKAGKPSAKDRASAVLMSTPPAPAALAH